ncbi:dihydrofolate reductase [Oenococcus alcoholitolerans]|uniref:dihydrofolate reductase n=1 Tax=Oenococcus alcoholitolerans TaxID=931074 RepID=UPI003F710528
MIIEIWAQSKNKVIGSNGSLPWKLPDDMKFFKEKTLGTAVVMGRKTFESFGSRPLPKRTNIILTRNKKSLIKKDAVKIVDSPEKAIKIARESGLDLFVIGGSEVYKSFMPYTDKIYVTMVNTEIKGDTYAPDIDDEIFEIFSTKHHPADNLHNFSFDFLSFQRKKSSLKYNN